MKLIKEYPNTKAMIFDLDGTLLDSMSLWHDVDRKYLANYGIEYKRKYSEDIKGLTFQQTALYFIENFNIPLDAEEIKNQWNEMVEIEYRDHIMCKDGVYEFLEVLKRHNIKMCIATSCNKKHAQMALKRLKIEDYFMFIHTSDEAGRNKEYPDIFCQCAEMMDVCVEDCFVVEDLYSAIKVAHNAKFKTIAMYENHQKNQIERIHDISNYYVKSFKELL